MDVGESCYSVAVLSAPEPESRLGVSHLRLQFAGLEGASRHVSPSSLVLGTKGGEIYHGRFLFVLRVGWVWGRLASVELGKKCD